MIKYMMDLYIYTDWALFSCMFCVSFRSVNVCQYEPHASVDHLRQPKQANTDPDQK